MPLKRREREYYSFATERAVTDEVPSVAAEVQFRLPAVGTAQLSLLVDAHHSAQSARTLYALVRKHGDIAEFLASGTPHARALAVGPGVPPDRVAVLRAAFDAMVKDPEFLDDARKRNLSIMPRSAEEVQRLAEKIVGASPEFIEAVKEAVGASR